MDFNARGKCMKPDCRSGCMIFIPCDGPPPAHPGLVRCAVCPADPGCCAAQHADTASVPNPTPPMPPPRTQGGGAPSATFHTMHASRGFAAPAMGPSATNPFKSHADRRQQDTGSKLNNPLNTSAGDPGRIQMTSLQSQLDGDLSPHGAKSKKRKRSSKSKKEVPSEGEPDDKRRAAASTKGPKPMATKCYSATLAENTKAVASKDYYKPSAAKLSEMNRQGLVKSLHLPKQPTAMQIREAVYTAFSNIPEVEIYGFHVLEVKAFDRRPGKARTPSTGELGMEMWERALAQTTVRDAGPGYRNTIFIALNPAAPNLAFPGVDCTLDAPDHDLSSSNFSCDDDSDSSDDEEKKSKGKKSKAEESDGDSSDEEEEKKPKEKKSKESDGEADDEGHSPLFSASENVDEDDPFGAPMHEDEGINQGHENETRPAVDENQLRLTKNIAKPDAPQKWWRTTVMAHLKDFNLIHPLIADLIDSAVAGHLQIDVFFTKINKYVVKLHVVKPLKFVKDLAICITDTGPGAASPSALLREFEDMFGLGPGGINIVLPILSMLYEGLARLCEQGLVPNYESHKVEYGLYQTSKGLVTCLTYFRENYHRSLWDPKGGFRELAYILRKHNKQLPVGTREHPMHAQIDSINLRFDSIASLRQSFQDAFGSATEGGQMLHTVIVGGEYGLRRFYAVIVEPLLDKVDRDDYGEVVKLCIDSCRALGRKCGELFKGATLQTKPGRGPKAPGSMPSAEDEGPCTRAQAQSRGASAPRNAKSGYFKTPREANDQFMYADELYTDTAEDMTRTESAREDWYTNIKIGAGIKTRRKRRHTTEQVPSSDSEDYCMPKPRKAPVSPEYIEIDDLAASPSPERTPEEQQHAQDLEEAEALLKLEWFYSALSSRFPGMPGEPANLLVCQDHESLEVRARHRFALRKKILTRFPHPNPKVRATLKRLNRETDTAQFKKLIFAYHPDRNYGQTEHWKAIASKISAAINKGRRQPNGNFEAAYRRVGSVTGGGSNSIRSDSEMESHRISQVACGAINGTVAADTCHHGIGPSGEGQQLQLIHSEGPCNTLLTTTAICPAFSVQHLIDRGGGGGGGSWLDMRDGGPFRQTETRKEPVKDFHRDNAVTKIKVAWLSAKPLDHRRRRSRQASTPKTLRLVNKSTTIQPRG
ncbi:hypothetical protein C8R47DRAFT_1238755 [Mycena vitilis]|nr:hypothetical protein C8R47DRAFT_1238755 [Mycena vitilis]